MINKINIRNAAVAFLLLGNCIFLEAQITSVTPTVVSSAGGFYGQTLPILGASTLSFTIGESMGQTYNVSPFTTVKFLTQGFQQPQSTANTLSIQLIANNSSCIGANNGSVAINPTTFTGPVTYSWNGGSFSTTNIFTNLTPGTYHYQITDGSFTITDSVIVSEDAIDCGAQLIFYQGFTPNGDLHNDTWIIEGIKNFTTNEVSIFNRWGDLVWTCKDYDNITNGKVWDGSFYKTGKPLPDATYFYVITAGTDNKPYKGWIELTH